MHKRFLKGLLFILFFVLFTKQNVQAAEIRDMQVVDKNHVWTINLAKPIYHENVTIWNVNDNTIVRTATIKIGEDKKSIVIEPPKDGYDEGSLYNIEIESLIYPQQEKPSSEKIQYKFIVKNPAANEYEAVESKPGATYTFSNMDKLLASNQSKGWNVSTIKYDNNDEGTLIETQKDLLKSLIVPLKLNGYFKVYVGYASGTSGFKIKKDTDHEYIQVRSAVDSSSSQEYGNQHLYEKLALIDNFNNCNLVLKEIGNTRIAYIRLVGLTNDQIKLIQTPDEGENGKRVMYDNDGYSDFFDGIYSSPEDLKTKFVYPLAEKNVGTINWCLGTTGLLNYNSKYAGIAFAGFDKYKSQLRQGDIRAKNQVLNILKSGKSPLEIVAEAAKEKNMKVNASLRMDTFYPKDKYGYLNGKIYDSYQDCKQTGEYGLSYFYPKTRAYITNILKEAVSFKNVDGVTLDYCRYPVVMNKEATQQQKVAIMTEFMRTLRKEIPKGKTITVRIPYNNPLSYGFNIKAWIKEGLIDVLIPSNITIDDFFNVKPYVDMVRGTNVKLYIGICANVSGSDLTKEEEKYLQAGYEIPKRTSLALNHYLLRAREVYKAGAEGVFLFNTSSAILIDNNSPEISKLLSDKVALEKWYNFSYEQPMQRKNINIIEKK
ncbi:hypothetical protein [Clostridium tagluense]|uniref:hypothetical protein n=1 Tax=Clostridium tagluense TaxID=360422 RepID=UPI001C0B7DD9|nr:hypothetical protein [Clostridium tagluense]MBU3130268.1 hypothetical protein [Clostridium tagluense]